jgi:hypothetical protein
MSWWETVDGSTIGDQPADVLGQALKDLANAHEARGKPKPTLAEVLAATASLVRTEGAEFLTVGEPRDIVALTATLDGEPGKLSVAPDQANDDEIQRVLRKAFREIARTYQERWDRNPTLRELLAVMAFVLRAEPDAFLAESEGLSIAQIAADSKDG